MLLGCKGQFVPKIVDGTKPHSFRAKRKDGRKWKVGDSIQFYENVRQPNMRKIRPDGVVKGVQDAKMVYLPEAEYKLHILLNGRAVFDPEIEEILQRDGFNDLNGFIAFFFPKKNVNVWEGQLIHWTDLKY